LKGDLENKNNKGKVMKGPKLMHPDCLRKSIIDTKIQQIVKNSKF